MLQSQGPLGATWALLQPESQSSAVISICAMYTAKVSVHHSIMCSCCCHIKKGKKMETRSNEVIFLPIYNLRLRWCQASQAKPVWMTATFERRKSKGNIYFSKSASADSTGSSLTAKSETNQDCVWHMDVTLAFTDWGKIVQKPFSLLCQTIPEGIIRLVTFTLKICNFLLNHKKLYWSSNCCNFWGLSIISTKLWIIHEFKKKKKSGHSGRGQSYWHYYSSTGGAAPSREFLCRTAVVGLHPFPGVRGQDLDWAHNPHSWPLVTAESHTVIFTRVVEVLGRIKEWGELEFVPSAD